MLRTVHVRTAFPTGARASRVAMYSESGRADASRSLFFVLSHATHAERLGRLIPGFFKSPSGWRSAESLIAQIRAAALEVERTSDSPVSLALVLIDAPRLVCVTRGDGVGGYDAGSGMRITTRLRSGRPLLGARDDGAGWQQWSTEPLPGHRFFVGLRDGLDRLDAGEVEALGALVGRERRAALPGAATQGASGRAGALVVGRINHVPWTSARALPEALEPVPASPGWRARAGAAAALAVALGVFLGLVRAGDSPAPRGTMATAHAAEGREAGDGAAWRHRARAQIEQAPLEIRGLLFAPCADGSMQVIDRETGAEIRRIEEVGRLSAPPLLSGGRILAAGLDRRLSLRDPSSGSELLGVDLPSVASALVGDRDRAWVVAGREVLAVDLGDPGVDWRLALAEGEITGIDVARGVGVVASRGRELTAFNPWSGKTRWHASLDAPPAGAPAIVKGVAYLATADGGVVAHEMLRGKRRWRAAIEAEITAGLVADGEYVYVGTVDGELLALAPRTGEVAWRARLTSPDPASLLLSGDVVMALSHDGHLETFDCRDGTPAWSRYFSSSPRSHPVLSGNRLIAVVADGVLEALDWRPDEAHARL